MKNLFCWILFPTLLKTFFHTSSYIFWNISSSLWFNTVDPFFYFVNILGEVFDSESFFILVVSIPDKAHTDFNLFITTFNCLFANRVQSLLALSIQALIELVQSQRSPISRISLLSLYTFSSLMIISFVITFVND